MAESERASQLFTNSLYDKLQFIAQVFLPALATFWFAVGGIWGLPNTGEIVGTITAADAMLGLLLRASSKKYYETGANFDGDVIVQPEDGGHKVTLSADRPLEDIVDEPGKHSVEFKVQRVGER